ncbi:hypothetical protein [Dyella acidiphila]|uniref:DUF1579 domain-containing protein n=1 Tax=Dyella acidiphila TaxID=2775866 RepID=A0ABR9GF93_9GAMM|nr:hypothetical protein [Dyella acidiphila]MBE1162720.1 hypothetical protein [Dyella acidiphila]
MNSLQKILLLGALTMLGVGGLAPHAQAQNAADTAQRDGSHDFDFNIGTWRTHIRTLTDAKTWTELNGTVTVRKIWGGKASMEEIDARGPGQHLEGMTLFLYNPQSHQWSQTFASTSDGILETPAIGGFKDGHGELIDQESYQGRMVLVRNQWSEIQPNSHHFEISFSTDNGRTWQPNFVADLSRIQ